MRNRETEWSHPMARFLGALFIPPLCSTVFLAVLTYSTENYAPTMFPDFLYSFMVSVVPSIFWLVSMEKLYETRETIRSSRLRFTVAGALLGAILGIAFIWLMRTISGGWRDFAFILNPTYLILGLIVGYITAHTIFPKQKNEPNQAVEDNAGQPPPASQAQSRRASP